MTPAAIKALRTRSGLTQAKFGALIQASERSVRGWESGLRQIPWAKGELLRQLVAKVKTR